MSVGIIYYSSNREDPAFEEKIMADIKQNSNGLPIVSVTQKPVDMGRNVCVGDVGHSVINSFRQVLIAASESKTDYIIFTESDFIYGPEYFRFEPKGDDLYRFDNIWCFYGKSHLYYRIPWSCGAQIAKREFIIAELRKYLEGINSWTMDKPSKKDYNGVSGTMVHNEVPFLSYKSGRGLSTIAGTKIESVTYLEPWGKTKDIKRKFGLII